MTTTGTSIAQKLRLRENQIFIALTILIGVISGLSAVLFTLAIRGTQHFLFGQAAGHLRLFLVPTLTSVVTGVLLWKFFPDCRGSGVPQTEAAYLLDRGVISGRVPIGKFLTGALCVGSGHSMGREGPSVQIGAGLASVIGRWFQLGPDRVRELVPIGASAALAAAFNTPVAAVLFSLEEIIGDMNAGLIGSTVIAAVTSVIVERSILGNQPLFHVPAYHLVSPLELLPYTALGIIGGLISVFFCKTLLALRGSFMRMPGWTTPLQPALGGAAIGGIIIFFPQVMGVGYAYVDQALNGGLVLKTLLILCGVKLIATIVSYASGNAGGIFAPSLYFGAMAGGAVGIVVHRFAPFPSGDVGAYALVGMGVLFAGIIRAPMTSVFMIFELTQDYQILVPLMIANMLSFLISKHYLPQPIYHVLLEQSHVYLPGPESRLSTSTWRAKDIMSREVEMVDPSTPTQEALGMINGDRSLLIGVAYDLQGIIGRSALEDAVARGEGQKPVLALADVHWTHVHPDHPLEFTLERFSHKQGILPVIRRGAGNRIEGAITRESIMQFVDRDSDVNGQ